MAKEADTLVTATPKHIESVRKKIEEIKKAISGSFFDLGDLLQEVRDGGFHMSWGYANFGEWLETSGLDMSERAAYYLIKVVQMGKTLNIPREKLEQVKISKLREIASLDVVKDAKKIKRLIDACVPDKEGREMSLADVKENVAKVKAGNEELDTFVFVTLKFTKSCKENVFDPAIEMARSEYGDTLKADGENGEITPGRAIEMILANYMAGDHGEEEQPLSVEGQRALNAAPVDIVEAAEFDQFDTKPEVIPDAEVFTPQDASDLFKLGDEDPDEDNKFAAEVADELSFDPYTTDPVELKLLASEAYDAEPRGEAVLKELQGLELIEKIADNPTVIAKLAEEGLKVDHDAVDAAVADCKRRIAEANERIKNATVEDDPLLTDAVLMLQENPEATANTLKLTLRIGEVRAFNLFKMAKGKL